MTDKKLLHLLDQNPEEGMGLLMEEYMGLLWSACRLYLTNPEDIRECVQETFADFYGNRERFRTEKGTIKAYLYVIAKRKAIRMAAQNGKQSMVPLEMLKEAAADSGEDAILNREALEQALGKLKEQDSRMIRMQYYDGLTCREVAEAMHLPTAIWQEKRKKASDRACGNREKAPAEELEEASSGPDRPGGTGNSGSLRGGSIPISV